MVYEEKNKFRSFQSKRFINESIRKVRSGSSLRGHMAMCVCK